MALHDVTQPKIATIEHDGRTLDVTCRIAFDGIEYVGRLWFTDTGQASSAIPDRGALPGRSRDEVVALANRLTPPELALRYRRLDRSDVWPYEPRDPATYNIFQPHKGSGSRWRPDYYERLASYGYEYAYAVVLGFNLPKGVRWSEKRRQYVAREPADTRRGGGIFLHVQRSRYTAGCVAGPIDDVRWLVRWLDPAQRPRIVMGPTGYVKRRF